MEPLLIFMRYDPYTILAAILDWDIAKVQPKYISSAPIVFNFYDLQKRVSHKRGILWVLNLLPSTPILGGGKTPKHVNKYFRNL